MTTTPADSDPFFQLLTEALRAGPGSAQWGDAVAKLRDGGIDGADEYRLIIRAREDLESGRDYRRVTAGQGFTRKVLDAIDREGSRRRGVPTATIIAIVSGVVILAVVVTLIVMISRGGADTDARQAAVAQLEGASFPVAMSSAAFTQDGGALPAGWRAVGELPLDAKNGLKAGTPTTAPATTQGSGKFIGGGVITTEPLAFDAAAAIDIELVLPPAGGVEPLTQVFVADAADGAAGSREIIWIYRDGRVSVDVNGKGQESIALGTAGETLDVSIRLNHDTVILETGNRRLYAGPHGLAPGKLWYVGARFIRATGDAGASATIRSINISQSARKTSGGGQ